MDIIIPALIIIALAAALAYGILNCYFSSVKIDLIESADFLKAKENEIIKIQNEVIKALEDLEFAKELKK